MRSRDLAFELLDVTERKSRRQWIWGCRCDQIWWARKSTSQPDKAWSSLWLVLFFHPVFAERAQAGKGFAILLAVRGRLARNNVVNVTHGKAFDLNPPPPGVFEMFYPVRSEHEVKVEWAVFQLHKIL